MPTFSSKPYPSASRSNALGERYRAFLRRQPFLLFGLPFMLTMLAGSFFLTPATAVRYERYDRKVHMLDKDQALGLGRVRGAAQDRGKGRGGGKGDIREEYWRLSGREKDLDNWEVKRVERLPGEPDGTFD